MSILASRRFLASVGDFLLPKMCLGCSSEGSLWCVACATSLDSPPFRARDLLLSRECYENHQSHVPLGLDVVPVFAAAHYQGPAVRLINLAKERGSPIAQRLVAKSLLASVQALIDSQASNHPGLLGMAYSFGLPRSAELGAGSSIAVVPIPTTTKARRVRGGHPLGEITKLVIKGSQLPLELCSALTNARSRQDQASLTIGEREANVAGSFAWANQSRQESRLIILVDDVVTTGATLRAAASALRQAGLVTIGCAVVAATRRRVHFVGDV